MEPVTLKEAPKTLLILLTLVVSLEVFTALVTFQPTAFARLAFVTFMCCLVLNGSRTARRIFIVLLILGSISVFMAFSESPNQSDLSFVVTCVAALILFAAALHLGVSDTTRSFLEARRSFLEAKRLE